MVAFIVKSVVFCATDGTLLIESVAHLVYSFLIIDRIANEK